MKVKMHQFFLYSVTLISVSFLMMLMLHSCTKPALENKAVISSSTDEAATAAVAEATYKIIPVSNAANVIALNKQSIDDSIVAHIKTYNKDSLSHHWRFTKTANGIYRISCGYSGKVLATHNSTAVEGQSLWQTRYDSSDNQLWKIKKNASGQYSFYNKATGYYINLESNGNITQRKSTTSQSQLWNLTAVTAIYCDVDATNFFRRTEGWTASDGDVSFPLTDGRVMWTSGDGHINDYDYATRKIYCLFQVHNAGLIQPSSHSWHWPLTGTLVGNTFPGIQSYFKNKADDNYWIWPGAGFQVAGNDTIYVFNAALKKKDGGGFGWDQDGYPLWGKVLSSTMKVVQYSALQEFNGISFGHGFIVNPDGYVYAYGSKTTFIEGDIYVARFPSAHPNAKWKFWTGTTWDTAVTKAASIGRGATVNASVAKAGDKYICFSSEFSLGCDNGTHIYTSVSDSPTGPFTARKAIYSIPDRYQGHIPVWYGANGHPEYTLSNNELLVTYAIGGYSNCIKTCTAGRTDPDLGRPRAIRVPISLITN